jgi:SAM-dependent methyltransferase
LPRSSRCGWGIAVTPDARPNYDAGDAAMLQTRAPQAKAFAKQIVDTTRPFLPTSRPWHALDVGCGYGHTARELAAYCELVVGLEPYAELAAHAQQLARDVPNLEIRHSGIYELDDRARYDLIVLDNVLEHLPDQPRAIAKLANALAPGGALYILVPNKLWPIEVHYKLPFLSYLPLPLANRYLKASKRGTDYTDASYAPTYWRMKQLFAAHPELTYHFTLPADLSLAAGGQALHYRLGVAAIKRFPLLWAISKAFLVIAVKDG